MTTDTNPRLQLTTTPDPAWLARFDPAREARVREMVGRRRVGTTGHRAYDPAEETGEATRVITPQKRSQVLLGALMRAVPFGGAR